MLYVKSIIDIVKVMELTPTNKALIENLCSLKLCTFDDENVDQYITNAHTCISID